MRKLFSTALFCFGLMLYLFSMPVQAADVPNVIGIGSLGELIQTVSGLVVPLAVLGFVGTIIYAGYIRMFATGNPEKEAKSMKVAVGAAIGFAIIALAPLIVKLLATILQVNENVIS